MLIRRGKYDFDLLLASESLRAFERLAECHKPRPDGFGEGGFP